MSTSTDTFVDAQHDMRFGYFGGAPGVLASAIAWLAAALVAKVASPVDAVWALFIGGMFIFPVGVVLAKLLGRPGKHSRTNPLGPLVMEGTILLMLALPLAFAVSLYRIEWFFPAMLLVIGGRYLTFATLYGTRIYWALGGILAIAAFVLVATRMPPAVGALTGGLIEIVFAAALFYQVTKVRRL
jgi:hypothetical protein